VDHLPSTITVLLVGTYDQDDKANFMIAAWGGTCKPPGLICPTLIGRMPSGWNGMHCQVDDLCGYSMFIDKQGRAELKDVNLCFARQQNEKNHITQLN